jgi:hypothetical protein
VWLLAFDELLKHGPKDFHQCLRLGSTRAEKPIILSHNLEPAMRESTRAARWGARKLKEQPASSPSER